jgi:hypothetical protein
VGIILIYNTLHTQKPPSSDALIGNCLLAFCVINGVYFSFARVTTLAKLHTAFGNFEALALQSPAPTTCKPWRAKGARTKTP